MREIKFRAWHLEGKYMLDVAGFDFTAAYSSWFGPGVGDGIFFIDDTFKGKRSEGKDKVNSILMQYTGLKDKNGKEIFEGDVIKHKQFEQGKESQCDVLNGVVKFHNGAFYINANGRFSNIYLHDIDGIGTVNRCWHGHNGRANIYEGASEFEIIGNIYESPELLK